MRRMLQTVPCRTNDGGQYLHRLTDDSTPTFRPAQRPIRRRETAPPKQNWPAFAALFAKSADPHLQRLAEKLGVSKEALVRSVSVGMLIRYCWTFPERDAIGQIIGLATHGIGTVRRNACFGGRRV